jgi:hypothetical protein
MKTLCRSWLLILILFGWFSPSLDAQTATVIPDTEAARHIGLSRGLAKIATDREEAWRGRWLPYYRELGIDPEIPVTRVDIPSFDDARCRVVATRRCSPCFHLPGRGIAEKISPGSNLAFRSSSLCPLGPNADPICSRASSSSRLA